MMFGYVDHPPGVVVVVVRVSSYSCDVEAIPKFEPHVVRYDLSGWAA
jgi:hypothetical protein